MNNYGYFIAATKNHKLLVCRELTHEPDDEQLKKLVELFETDTYGDFIGYLIYKNVIYKCLINANDGGLDKIIPERFDTGVLSLFDQLLSYKRGGVEIDVVDISNILNDTLQLLFDIYDISVNYVYNTIENIEFEDYFKSVDNYLYKDLQELFGGYISDIFKIQTDSGDYNYSLSIYLQA